MKRALTPLLFLWLVIFSLYGLTSARTMTGFGDSDELITAGFTLSIPHPPGYPFLIGLIYIFSHFPFITPAQGAQLVGAFTMSVSMTIMYLLCLQLLAMTQKRKVPGQGWLVWLSVFGVSMTGLIWEHGTIVEVFSLNVLFSLLLLYLSLKCVTAQHNDSPILKYVMYWGIVAGLGMAHHQTFSLIALPLSITSILLLRKQKQLSGKLISFGLIATILSFVCSYGLLLIFGLKASVYSWAFKPSLSGLWHFYTRADYSGYFPEVGTLSAWWSGITISKSIESLGFYFQEMWRHWGVFGSLGLVGLLTAKKRLKQLYWLLLAPWFLAGPLFACYTTLLSAHTGSIEYETTRAITERMYLLSESWWGIFTIFGAIWVATFLQKRMRLKKHTQASLLAKGCLFLLAAGTLVIRLPAFDLSHYRAVQDYTYRILSVIPINGRLICLSDLTCFGTTFVQAVLGQRQDVVVVSNAPQYRYVSTISKSSDLSRFHYEDSPFRLGEIVGWSTYKGIPLFITQLNDYWAKELGLNTEAFWLLPTGFSFEILRTPPSTTMVNNAIVDLPLLENSSLENHRFIRVFRAVLAEQYTLNAHIYARMGLPKFSQGYIATGLTAFPTDEGLLKMQKLLPGLKQDQRYSGEVDEISYIVAAQDCRKKGNTSCDLWQSRWMAWRNPVSVVARLNLAVAFEQAGLLPLAKREYSHSLELDHTSSQAKAGIVRTQAAETLP